jgi:DNA-binding IclR family transcriptional regulator
MRIAAKTGQNLSVVMKLGGARPLHGSSIGSCSPRSTLTCKPVCCRRRPSNSSHGFTLTNRDALTRELGAIRERGYSVTDGESVEGITGLATPIFDATGTVNAAGAHLSAARAGWHRTGCPSC